MTQHRTKAERQRQILEAAARCFAVHGYHETSMDDIVSASGMSKGSLYWHFESKRHVFKCLMDMWFAEFQQTLRESVEGVGDAPARVRAIFNVLATGAMLRPELVRAQVEFFSIAMRDPEYLVWLRGMYAEFVQLLRGVIEQGVHEGAFRSVDTYAVAGTLSAAIDGLLIQRIAYLGGAVEPPAWDHFADTLLLMLEHPK